MDLDMIVKSAFTEAGEAIVQHADMAESSDVVSNVLPYKVISPDSFAFRPYENCVPLTSLKAAAGSWRERQSSLEPLAGQADQWVVLDGENLSPGMFVAKVEGHSMEPLVPAGSYCLFWPVPAGTREGEKLLIWATDIADDETGGQYTLKVYHSEKVASDDGSWQHQKIVLKPLNSDYQPIVLEPDQKGDVRVVVELVRSLES